MTRITNHTLSSKLQTAKSPWIASSGELCISCDSRKNASLYFKNLQTTVSEKDDSQKMVCYENLAEFESMMWIFLNTTLMVHSWLNSPVTNKPKSPLMNKYVSLEYTKYMKMDVTGKLSSPVKTASSVVKRVKLIFGSFRNVVQPFPGRETCSICKEIISKKRFFDERRFGLLRNCDHVVCYGCVRKLRESSGDGKSLSKNFGVALGPVHCPNCGVVSDKVAASSRWIVGAEKVEFFKTFDKNFSPENVLKQITEDFKYLDKGIMEKEIPYLL